MSYSHFNPNSAKTRIQNHLAYKLGLALIEYDKQRKGISKKENFNTKESLNHTINSHSSLNPKENLKHSIPVRGGGAFISFS